MQEQASDWRRAWRRYERLYAAALERRESHMGPHPDNDLRERNRKLMAGRLCWPHEALGRCQEIEAQFPAYYVWWSAGTLPTEHGEGYYARLIHRPLIEEVMPAVYAPTADGLVILLSGDKGQQGELWLSYATITARRGMNTSAATCRTSTCRTRPSAPAAAGKNGRPPCSS
jgi:hypothetical protein